MLYTLRSFCVFWLVKYQFNEIGVWEPGPQPRLTKKKKGSKWTVLVQYKKGYNGLYRQSYTI